MKQYKPKTLEQAATVALETAVQDAIGVLRECTDIKAAIVAPTGRFAPVFQPQICYAHADAERILLAAAVTAESLLGRAS